MIIGWLDHWISWISWISLFRQTHVTALLDANQTGN